MGSKLLVKNSVLFLLPFCILSLTKLINSIATSTSLSEGRGLLDALQK